MYSPNYRLWVGLIVLGAVLALFPATSQAQLFYPSKGEIQSVHAAQLWYNGYWKHPGWLNGTMVKYPCTDCQGKIILMGNIISPYERNIRRAIAAGGRALVIARNRPGVAGQGMYFLHPGTQTDLTIPVVEIYQLALEPNSILQSVGTGMEVSLWPQENGWKKANEGIAFQVICNIILSGMETSIIIIGMYRLNQWTSVSCARLGSIGPVCIMLEIVSSILRLILTLVDPFFTLRIYTAIFSMVMMTISMPFVLSSGILLTFYWAETLKASSIKAYPFIAEYRKSAFVVIFFLFAGEMITSAVRSTVPVKGKFNTAYLMQTFYSVVALILVVCYLLCAREITKRLAAGGAIKRKKYIRSMNIRFALSTSGYVLFVITMIASAIIVSRTPWGWKIVFNLMYFSLNLAGLLQVYSLKPASSKSSSTSGSSAKKTESGGPSQQHSNNSHSSV